MKETSPWSKDTKGGDEDWSISWRVVTAHERFWLEGLKGDDQVSRVEVVQERSWVSHRSGCWNDGEGTFLKFDLSLTRWVWHVVIGWKRKWPGGAERYHGTVFVSSAVSRHDLWVKSRELVTEFSHSLPFTHAQHSGRFSSQTRSQQQQILGIIQARVGAAGSSRQRQEETTELRCGDHVIFSTERPGRESPRILRSVSLAPPPCTSESSFRRHVQAKQSSSLNFPDA